MSCYEVSEFWVLFGMSFGKRGTGVCKRGRIVVRWWRARGLIVDEGGGSFVYFIYRLLVSLFCRSF